MNTPSLLKNPATSYWLVRAVIELENRDVQDALIDAEHLLAICQERAREAGLAV